MTARKTCGLDPMPCTPTLLPFRSSTLRMRSFANSSKQPECTPASTVIGSPASIERTRGAAKFKLKSSSPRAILSE